MSDPGFAGLGALLWLARARARGRMRAVVRAARRPRRALLMLLGLALVTLFVWAGELGESAAGDRGGSPIFRDADGRLLLAAFLTFFLCSTVVASIANGAMAFSRAEITLLFPGPIASRALISSHLISASTKAFTGALVFSLFMRPGGGSAWPRVLGGYLLLFLTLTAVALVLDLAHMHLERRVRRRRALSWALALAACLLGAVVATRGLDGRWSVEVLRYATLPGQLYAGLLTIDQPARLAAHAAGAVAMLGLLVGIALRWRRPIRTGALHTSDRVQHALERFRRGGPIADTPRARTDGRVLPMLPRWRGAGVHVWRQLSALRRKRKAFGLLIAFSLVMAGAITLSGREPRPDVGALVAIAMLLFMGPLYVQCDFRSDIDGLAWLRSLPCSATALAAGQILASTLVLTGLQWLLGGWGVLFAPREQVPGWIAGLCALPVLNMVVLAVENGVFLLHPVRLDGSKGPPGASQIVRMYGVFLVKALVLGAVLGMAALAGTGVGWALDSQLAGLAVGLITLALETALLVVIVGRLFRSVDPGADVSRD